MTALVIVLALFAALAISGSAMRRNWRDRRATERYQQALDTLGHLNRPKGSSVRIIGREQDVAATAEGELSEPPEIEAPSRGQHHRRAPLPPPGPRYDETPVLPRNLATFPSGEAVKILRDTPSGEFPRAVVPPSASPRPEPEVGDDGTYISLPTAPTKLRFDHLDQGMERRSRRDSSGEVPALGPGGTAGEPVRTRDAGGRTVWPTGGPRGLDGTGPASGDGSTTDGGTFDGGASQENGVGVPSGSPALVFGAPHGEPVAPAHALKPLRPRARSLPASARRTRVLAGAVAAVVVVVGVGVGIGVSRGGGSPKPKDQHLAAPPSVPQSTTTVAPPTTPAPTTTVPRPPFTVVSTSTDTATYQVNGPGQITLHASGPCWVQVNQTSSSGTSVFSATMAAGQAETVNAPVWIRIGAPANLGIDVNGSPLPALSSDGDPFDLQLQ